MMGHNRPKGVATPMSPEAAALIEKIDLTRRMGLILARDAASLRPELYPLFRALDRLRVAVVTHEATQELNPFRGKDSS
jgi:hypothetical protein